MLVFFLFTRTKWIFTSCWFYFLRPFGSVSSFSLQLIPCSSPAWPSIWPPSWPPCCSLGSLSQLTECVFWNPNLVTRDRIKALTAPHCYRLKFIFVSLVFSAFHALDPESVSSSASHRFLPPRLWGSLLHTCSLSLPWTPTFFPLTTWPIPFLSQDSALMSPLTPACPL